MAIPDKVYNLSPAPMDHKLQFPEMSPEALELRKMIRIEELITPEQQKEPPKKQSPQKFAGLDLKRFCKEDFIFGTKLGKGKYGDVYLAREKITNIILAIKVLDKITIKRLCAQKQVIREIKIHSYLSHPNIIKLYGVFHDDDNIYMMMEYAPNGEIYKELKLMVMKRSNCSQISDSQRKKHRNM